MELLYSTTGILLLIFGFGFVIFWHELGHFLAAKWVGIKVEQFAVGFGQAMFSWRKGMGWTLGSSNKKLEELKRQEKEGVPGIDTSKYGETEYRLNWIPLGGYVKMLGQDDLNPNAQQDDPRAYNKKSIGARMIVVSAGVIMNIILAAIGFMVLFLIGFNAPPAIVGSVLPHSPAQQAGLRVGDRILYLDDKYQHGFTHLTLNTALAEAGQSIPVYVERADGTREHLTITPRQIEGDTNGFLMLGVEQARELRAPEKVPSDAEKLLVSELTSADTLALRPGDIITEINGQPVDVQDIHKLDQALQTSGGQPVQLTVKSADGSTRPVEVHPRFTRTFNELARPLNFFGMLPRPQIASVDPRSPARGKILPGDVIIKISSAEGEKSNPTTEELINWLNQAGNNGKNVTLTVLRGKETVEVTDITPSMKVASGRYGLGIGLEYDEDHAVVAGIEKESAAALAGIPESFEVLSVNDQPVTSWHDVKRILDNASADQPVVITGVTEARNERQFTLNVTEAQLAYVRDLRYTHSLFLRDYYEPRQTNNPLIAAWWGVVETRDFVLQFYLTLQRMFQGSVSYKNMMGPVGIFHAGTMFAERGTDWLIWFLSMISANLAVVNFLPIPIVDGGLFTFLIIEKIQGRPLSARTQSIAQVVGLAVLLSVFLLVTFQDITRLL